MQIRLQYALMVPGISGILTSIDRESSEKRLFPLLIISNPRRFQAAQAIARRLSAKGPQLAGYRSYQFDVTCLLLAFIPFTTYTVYKGRFWGTYMSVRYWSRGCLISRQFTGLKKSEKSP